MPAASAPSRNSQNRTWKIPDTKAGNVADATKVYRPKARSPLASSFRRPFLKASRVVEQRASPAGTDHEPDDRAQHPGDPGRGQHDPNIELALSRQRARRDQRRITRTRYSGSHDRD